ncbi:MAG: PAS domain S-box protein [Rhodospirillaceae bacterium]
MNRNKYYLNLGVSFAIMGAIAIAALTVRHFYLESRSDQATVTLNTAQSLGQTIENFVDTIDYVLQVSAEEIEHQIASHPQESTSISSFLARQQQRFPYIDLLRATNAEGETIHGQGVDPAQRASLAQRDYFKRLRQNPNLGMVIAEPIIGKISQKWLWLMARRINNPDRSFAGLVYASIFIDDLVRMFEQTRLPKGSIISLRDQEMRLLALAPSENDRPAPIGDTKIPAELQALRESDAREGTWVGGLSGGDEISRTYSVRRSGRYGFTVLVGVPVAVATAEWQQQSVVVIGFLVAFMLGSLLFVKLMARKWEQEILVVSLAAREREKNFLQTLIRTIPDLIWLKDKDGVYLACNREFEKFSGRPESEIVGRTDYDFMSPELAEFFVGHDRAAMAAGRPTINEEWITYADGGYHAQLRTTKTPMLAADGSLIGVLGIAHDITGLRRQEEALRRSEETLNRAQAVAHIGSWQLDIVSGRLEWSEETYRIFGLRPTTPLDLDGFIACIHPSDKDAVAAAWTRALGGAPYDIEHRVVAAGETRWVRERAVVEFDAAGRAVSGIGTVQDITDQRLLKEKLDEALLFMGESQSIAHVGGWKLNPESGYVTWTDEMYRLVGHPRSEPIDLSSALIYYSREDLQSVVKLLETAWETGAGFVRECRVITRSGNQLWVDLRCIGRVTRPDGDYIAGTLQDISRHKNAEAALNEERRARESIIDSIPGIFYAMDQTGKFLFWNRNFEQVTERDPEDIAELTAVDLFSGDARALIADAIHEAFERGDAVAQASLVTKSGRELPYFFTGRRVDIAGRTMIVGAGIDITLRLAAEDALRRLNSELETRVAERTAALQEAHRKLVDTQFAMDAVGIGILWVDFDSGQIIHANRFAAESLGYTVGEFLRLRVTDIDPHYTEDRFRANNQRIRDEGHLLFETEQKTKGGRIVPVEVNVYYHPAADGAGPRMIAFQSDITQRREAQQALLKAKEAAEAANQAKSAFLANVSHEIRTPLNAILGLNHLMRTENLSPSQVQRLAKMDVAGRHLLSIINDVLDLSKIEAGGLELETSNFHLSAVLDNVASIVRESAISKGLALEIDPDGVPLWLRGDVTRLRQALLNFAGNAIKFTERGSVTLRAILLSGQGNDLSVRFEVQDTGIGLTSEQARRLFQVFEQADSSTARKYGGTGLGLALTRRLIDLMKGTVGLDSTVGVGSTFWFTVPLQRGHGPMPQQSSGGYRRSAEVQLREKHRGANILLAEDNIVNIEVVQQILHAVGLNVTVANNGREAISLALTQKFSLILMDMQMPEVDGLEATRTIRSVPGYARTPIIALTANAFVDDRRACLDAGMNDTLTKPVHPVQLYGALAQWLSVGEASLPDGGGPEGPADDGQITEEVVVRALSRVPGIDTNYGLAMLRGQTDKYLALLRRFLVSHGDVGTRLGTYLTGRDIAAARRSMHALKGAASTMGLTAITDLAVQLETLLKDEGAPAGQDAVIRSRTADLETAVQALAAALPPIASDPQSAAPTLDPKALRSLLGGLETLLEENDMAALTYMEKNKAALGAALGPAFATCERQIRSFSFEAAVATLHSIQ